MHWMGRSRGRRGSSGFLIPCATALVVLLLFSLVSLIAFIPKVVVAQLRDRKHRQRVEEYQKRRALFEARGWGWDCT